MFDATEQPTKFAQLYNINEFYANVQKNNKHRLLYKTNKNL